MWIAILVLAVMNCLLVITLLDIFCFIIFSTVEEKEPWQINEALYDEYHIADWPCGFCSMLTVDLYNNMVRLFCRDVTRDRMSFLKRWYLAPYHHPWFPVMDVFLFRAEKISNQ